MKKREIKTDGGGGLTHNPFAALGGKSSPKSPESPAPAAREARPTGGSTSKVVVRREKKGRRGKTVTRVCGLSLDATGLAELQRELKKSLGCGASLEDGEIVLQGELTERAAKWLRDRLGESVTIGN